ncbi:G-protein coupled receptor family C group 6 member A-like [Bufo gargarizans]|uniref:G-protein coupled receptor family C group 6 member A-like n=1 Tax=Bufo gargarizans TaxID=30331 RepID=UPI001CF2D4E5|nr:G-protein coupled receptor family C group 6 member A-like [Bufo gargarizans]XP_044147093.1 G-protein coupled receptor family C group 6 member A-like [Bufo gargarizans]
MIGGIFPIHEGVTNLLERPYADGFNCTGLDLRSISDALGMIYAIETINNSTALQGIKLGYEIYDSCADGMKAIQATMKLIPEFSAKKNSTECNYTDVIPTVKAVIGEEFSEISIVISRILSTYFIPQISAASTVDTLSDPMRYLSFLRTVPSDQHQTRAVVELIRTFKWNWVGIITSNDDYGRSALDFLSRNFLDYGICTAFSDTIPTYTGDPGFQNSLRNIISDLTSKTTNVVVVFAKPQIVSSILAEALRNNISRTWIASDAWIVSGLVSTVENIENVGAIMGFTFKGGSVPGFVEYVNNIFPINPEATNEFLEEYKELRFGCTDEYRQYLQCKNSSSTNCNVPVSVQYKSPMACSKENNSVVNDDYLAKNIENGTLYSTSLAVAAIVGALKNMICKNGICDKNLQISPRQLLSELKKTNFFYNDDRFHFESSGEVLLGYNLINWHASANSTDFKIIGDYDTLNQRLQLNRSLLSWNTVENLVPFSNCTPICSPGYYKEHSLISCCYKCLPCAEDYYSSMADATECKKCPSWQWSRNGSDQCTNRTIEYFDWKDPFAISLMTLAAIAFLLVLITGVLFIHHLDTPAVKAAGGHYTFLMMISLLVSLVSIGFFIGEPTETLCKVRQPLFGISFTISVSCILFKSIRILRAFESASKAQKVVTLTYQPVVIISVLTGIQICICTMWLIFKAPFFNEISTIPQVLLYQCNEGSYAAFSIMLGYIGFLALICFILAYRGRKLPEKYNEARCITFSMLVYMFVWILFIPIYINSTRIYTSAVQTLAILASIYGIISCHLLPAGYIILFKKKNNNRQRYVESICAFYRAKRRILSNHKKKSNHTIKVIPANHIIACTPSPSSEARKRSNSF